MPSSRPTTSITVYGADWCSVTQATREYLDELGVPYRYVDTDYDAAASQWVRAHNNGLEIKPTLATGGHILTAPPRDALDAVLREQGLVASS